MLKVIKWKDIFHVIIFEKFPISIYFLKITQD